MGLSSYSELVASVSAWLDGSDLGGREGDLIALCEDEINARLASGIDQGAFIRPMVERGALIIDGEYVDLPDGNLVMPISIEVALPDRSWEVTFLSAGRLMALRPDEAADRAKAEAMAGAAAPRHYTIIGDELRFFPAPQQSFTAEFTRFSKVPALSDEVTSNWLLASHRNVYLYGVLAQAEFFGWNDSRMANVATLFGQAIDGIIARYPVPVDRASLRTDAEYFGLRGRALTASSFMNGGL